MSELVLVVWPADQKIPGLCNAKLMDRGTDETVEEFWDLTMGQIRDIARRRTATIESFDGRPLS